MRKKILITGSNGLVGSALQRQAVNFPEFEFHFVGRELTTYTTNTWYNDQLVPNTYVYEQKGKIDLRNEADVDLIYNTIRPNYVIHTAAKVGGITGNMAGHGDYFHDNILMNTHMVHYAKEYKVEKFLGFSSVCVFPDGLPLLTEDKIHEGPVYNSNFAYGYAKRMIDIQIQAYQKQFGIKNFCSIIPSNIYGSNDWYSIEHGHVIPSLMHKLYLANKNNDDFWVLGDGHSLREFIYSDDLANVCLSLLNKPDLPLRLLVTGDQEYSITEIASALTSFSGRVDKKIYFTGEMCGQRSRPTDKTLFNSLFPNFKRTYFYDGLLKSWNWFVDNYNVARK